MGTKEERAAKRERDNKKKRRSNGNPIRKGKHRTNIKETPLIREKPAE